ncbi:MAG: signal recognition particle-docking protein FtsY [Chlorobiota bacterium]|nr:MAG: signal recognition particle-docking protein FtsY [Chlorobiota bacterium]
MGFFDKIKKGVIDAVEETKVSLKETIDALRSDRLKEGLAKTREGIFEKLNLVLGTNRIIDDKVLDEIEEALLLADVGVPTTIKISDQVRFRCRNEGITDTDGLSILLQEEITNALIKSPSANNDKLFVIPNEKKPLVIIVVGVNGVGKTTTIGKLAFNYKNAGHKVIIGAADTFRAAANEQLEVWANRAGVDIVGQGQGADPAAVAYDTVKAAISRGSDVVIIDTAGRLHNKTNLMDELKKINRVIKKLKSEAPDEVFLVLDATTGQNAIQQAKEFMLATVVTGLVLTKLDGTAKGGVVIAIADTLSIPVRYIGVGEKIEDLQPFSAKEYAAALFEKK